MLKRVWTFAVRGDEPFTLEVQGNPSLVHSGGLSLWKLVADATMAADAARALREQGYGVGIYVEEQTPEQFMERSGHMALYVFRCATCGHQFEVQQGMSVPNPPCPKDLTEEADETPATCGGPTDKQIVAGGTFHLKGSGWGHDGYSGGGSSR